MTAEEILKLQQHINANQNLALDMLALAMPGHYDRWAEANASQDRWRALAPKL